MMWLIRGFAVAIFSITMLAGCGGGDGNDVIQPEQDYQLSEQEQKNKEANQAAGQQSDTAGFNTN